MAMHGIAICISEVLFRQGILRPLPAASFLLLGKDSDGRIRYAVKTSLIDGHFEELSNSDAQFPVIFAGHHRRNPMHLFTSPMALLAFLGLIYLDEGDFTENTCVLIPYKVIAQPVNTEAFLKTCLNAFPQISELHIHFSHTEAWFIDKIQPLLNSRISLILHPYAASYDPAAQLQQRAALPPLTR